MQDWHKATTATFRPLDLAVAQQLVEFAGRRANIGRDGQINANIFVN